MLKQKTSHIGLIYGPNPPLLTPVTWNDAPPLIYINDSSWFPGPEDQRGPEFPDEEGREFNLTKTTALGFVYPPLCIGPVPPCIPVKDQVWVTPKGEGTESYRDLFMLSGKGFQTEGLSTHLYPPPISTCPQEKWAANSSRIHWEECRGSFDRVLARNSIGTLVDWGPFGIAMHTCSSGRCSEPQSLKDKLVLGRFPKIVKFPYDLSIYWIDKVLAPPQLKMITPIRGPVQKTLWKVALALAPIGIWNGNLTKDNNKRYTFNFEKSQKLNLQACLKLPYVFLIGKFTIENSLSLVECFHCRLYTCIDSSIYNSSEDKIMNLRKRRGLWIPVRAPRVWEGSPTVHIVLQLLHKVVHRAKRFIGLLIAALMGKIAVTTVAAVSGVALHQTVQTTEFVQQWHENASKTWNQQVKIDEEINVRLVDLETTVVSLGDQLENLRTMISLKCDWNVTTYCVTPFDYNQTRTPWNDVRAHLLGHMPNLTVNIVQLQQEVDQMSSAKLQLLPGEDVLSAASDGLSSLNPVKWIKNLGGGFIGAIVTLIIVFCLFCLVFGCGHASLRKALNEETARSVFLTLQKQKGGGVVTQQPSRLSLPSFPLGKRVAGCPS